MAIGAQNRCQSEAIFTKSFHSEILKFLPQKAFQNGGGR